MDEKSVSFIEENYEKNSHCLFVYPIWVFFINVNTSTTLGQNEPTATTRQMNGGWTENIFQLGSSSLTNQGG
jgi:hypothetical protein